MTRERILSLTRADFRWDFFRCGGHGGQKVNKTASGCRCTHAPSGAVGQATDTRHQHQNRVLAFERCVRSAKFKTWLRVEHARRCGDLARLEAEVDEQMRRVRVEIRDERGQWTVPE